MRNNDWYSSVYIYLFNFLITVLGNVCKQTQSSCHLGYKLPLSVYIVVINYKWLVTPSHSWPAACLQQRSRSVMSNARSKVQSALKSGMILWRVWSGVGSGLFFGLVVTWLSPWPGACGYRLQVLFLTLLHSWSAEREWKVVALMPRASLSFFPRLPPPHATHKGCDLGGIHRVFWGGGGVASACVGRELF